MNWPLSHITLVVTKSCNLSCKGCYVDSTVGEEWNFDEFENKLLLPFIALGGKSIGFSGGEPLLYGKLYDAIRVAKHYHLFVSLVTNGLLLSYDYARSLSNLGVDSLQISLDSSDIVYNDAIRGRGNKASVIAAIKNANEVGLSTNLVAVPNRSLFHELESYVSEALQLNIRSIYLRRRIINVKPNSLKDEIDFNREFLRKILDIRAKYPEISIVSGDPLFNVIKFGQESDNLVPLYSGCSAGITSLAIWPNGLITPCTRLNVSIGNLYDDELGTIWHTSDILHDLRQRNLHGACGECAFKFLCGGCRASSYIQYKDLFAVDPMCFM